MQNILCAVVLVGVGTAACSSENAAPDECDRVAAVVARAAAARGISQAALCADAGDAPKDECAELEDCRRRR